MSTWVLEVGNTRAKWAKFPSAAPVNAAPELVKHAPAGSPEQASIWLADVAPGDRVMVTGSGHLEPWVQTFPDAWVLRPGDETPLPTDVREPLRLGLDRVANAWAVLHGTVPQAPALDAWLVVDVGTCVTVDVIRDGRHLGGTVSPGAEMRLTAMSTGTANLPRPTFPADEIPALARVEAFGLNTEEALGAGAWGGVSSEILGKWEAMRQEVPNLGVILTGGDAEHLELRFIRPKFADAHLTLKGYHALFNHAHPPR
ncbi:MAG: type III pantothenate kinase [Flavobacteriales bacterium]